jgi:hypothetical protein
MRHIAAAVALLMLAGGCFSASTARGRQQPLVSPDGNYVLTVPVNESQLPEMSGTPVWMVTISHVDGGVVHQDRMSEFPASFEVYWDWGPEGRVWLYNSDDGSVWFWEDRGDWIKWMWGHGRNREIDYDIRPPESIYPDYVE